MTTKKAYIAGKVSGLPLESVKSKFYNKAIPLHRKGYNIVNPVALIESINKQRVKNGVEPWTDETHRNEIMRQCIIFLMGCDELHLLPDWRESEGAIFERDMASRVGIHIVYP